MADDDSINEADLSNPLQKAQVFVLRVWFEAGALRLRIVPASNDAAPRHFTSWRALAEWGERGDHEPRQD